MHETESFIYSQDDLLGQGATANVYKGISKKDGLYRALKVFKNKRDSSWKLVKREMDVMSKIKHENIVQMLGMEIDHCTGQPILIMEYLNLGTLYDQLRVPQNIFGFSDEMYLSVLKDIAAGLKELHNVGIVHRDIKPNNILRSVMPRGREIYKLSDFGTAKKISSNDEMESLVGTEEYVHPAMYERVFINNEAKLTSSKHLDRWSLGITLYHVATGRVPFQTKEGLRKNRKCRLEMIKSKPESVISAKEDEHGEIVWETELPGTCILSRSLSKIIVNSIKNLLETSSSKAWTIPEFLTDVETILKKIPVHVTQPSQGRMEIFYLNPHDKIPHLKEAIAQELDVSGNQQILFNGCTDLTLPFETKSISEYPPTRTERPVILIEKYRIEDTKIPPLLIETITFPKEISLNDSSVALQICGEIYKIVRIFRNHSQINDCMMYSVGILNSMVGSEIRNTQQLLSNFRAIILKKGYRTSFESINSCEDFAGDSNIGKEYKYAKNLFKEARDIQKQIKSRKLITANLYYNTTERHCLETIFKQVKADFDRHEKSFAVVRGDFQKWQSKKIETLQCITNLKKQLIMDAAIHKKPEIDVKIANYRPRTNELIERSRTETKRLSDLHNELDQLVSSSLFYT